MSPSPEASRTDSHGGDSLPPELETLRAQLGRGLHQEVKAELKEEAAKPHRLRTRLYSVLGVLTLGCFFSGLWLLWPAHRLPPDGGPTGNARGQNPLGAVTRALDGPESGPWVSVNNRDAMEERRQRLEQDLALGAYAALDEARKAREEFEGAVKDALSGDAGRHVAASEDLVMQFRVIAEDRELTAAGKTLDAPPQTGVPDRTGADGAAARYRKARFNLGVLLHFAGTSRPRAATTLGEAVSKQRDDEAFEQLGVIAKEEKKAREEAIKKAAADAARKAREDEERRHWGVVKPGATWKGTLTDRGKEYETEVAITARRGDNIEGTNTWIAPDGVVHGLAFTGTCKDETITWRTTRRSVGYWGRPGSVHTGKVNGNSLSTSFVYPNEGRGVVGTISATLQPEK
jgi:hypothetical protein